MTTIKKQLAALPYIVDQNRPTILLVTSRKSVNWIIPKGWPKEGMPDRELVALEAYEEAGLSGTVGHNPVGLYTHPVGSKTGLIEYCRVEVYPFLVEYHYVDWPEKGQRKHTWLDRDVAAKLIKQEDLANIIASFSIDNMNRVILSDK